MPDTIELRIESYSSIDIGKVVAYVTAPKRLLSVFENESAEYRNRIEYDVGTIFDMQEFLEHDCASECPIRAEETVCNYSDLWLFEDEETQRVVHYMLCQLLRLWQEEYEDQKFTIELDE